jgi:large subunit ribosomal protein L10Ae
LQFVSFIRMSKLDSQLLSQSIDKVLAFAAGKEVDGVKGKVRGFTETIELQVTLTNYDPQKDKRFSGAFRLPSAPRPRMTVCMLGTEQHVSESKQIGIDAMSVDDLKKLNKNKKLVKKLAKKYDAFLASHTLIKQIPRLLGPGLNRAGKFPAVVAQGESLSDKVDEAKAQVKFALKKVLCLSTAVAHCGMSKEEITKNLTLAINFLVSLLKKNWQNVGAVYIKSSMGPAQQIYF